MFVRGPRFANYHDMTISREEAVERAKSIAVVAKANALEAEKIRRMPDENVQAIRGSGLMPLLRPREFGGFEADWITHIDCVAEVARFCGSTGWCMSFLLQHQFYLGYFPLATQKKVYDLHPDPNIATSFAPTGKVKRVPGGFELSGRWVFASGVDYCDWAIVGGKVETDGAIEIGNFLLSPGQFSVDPVWNSAGLKGSGSNDIVLTEPVFIPGEYFYSQADALKGLAPGSLALKGRLYRGPLALNAGIGVMTPIHGIARGAYEEFVSYIRAKVAIIGSKNTVDYLDVQTAIGESKAEIDLAHLLTQKLSAMGMKDGRITIDEVVDVRRDFILVQKLLRSAIDRLFALSGARGLDENQPLQRLWRDFHAISHHMAFAVPSMVTAGRRALGLGPAEGDLISSFDWEERRSAYEAAAGNDQVAA